MSGRLNYLWNQGSRNEMATQDDIRRIISGAGRGWSDDYTAIDLPDEWRTPVPVRHDPTLSECEWPGCSWRTSGQYCSKHPTPPKVIKRRPRKEVAEVPPQKVRVPRSTADQRKRTETLHRQMRQRQAEQDMTEEELAAEIETLTRRIEALERKRGR